MKLGTYQEPCKTKDPRLTQLLYLGKAEHDYLFHKADRVTNLITINVTYGVISIRRAVPSEVSAKIYVPKKPTVAQAFLYARLTPSLREAFGLPQPQYAHKAYSIPVEQQPFRGIPILTCKVADWILPDTPAPSREREHEPLYKPEEHPPGPIRHGTTAMAQPSAPQATDLATALELVNSSAPPGTEFFVENNRVRARLITIL